MFLPAVSVKSLFPKGSLISLPKTPVKILSLARKLVIFCPVYTLNVYCFTNKTTYYTSKRIITG